MNLLLPPRSDQGLGQESVVIDQHHIYVQEGIKPMFKGYILQQQKKLW